MRQSVRYTLLVLVASTLLAACASGGPQVGHTVTLCCPGNYQAYRAYGIELQDMPGFLSDYMVAEFDAALQDKGLVRNDRLNDLVVTLSYRHVNLNPEQEEIDPFERRIEEEQMLRYIANIVVEMRETDTGREVWAGRINRIHTVLPGEYMHEQGARPEIRDAFTQMLESYPAL